MKVTREKNCCCHTCEKDFHCLGIARHRAMHRDRREDCEITCTNGDTYMHEYSRAKETSMSTEAAIVYVFTMWCGMSTILIVGLAGIFIVAKGK